MDKLGIILPEEISFKDMENIYYKYFSLNGIPGEIDNKFALISLICVIYKLQKDKNPDITMYAVINKILEKNSRNLPDNLKKGLAVVCYDFYKGSSKFNTCGLKSGKEIIDKINEILNSWLPF